MDNLNPQLIPNFDFSPQFILCFWELFLLYHLFLFSSSLKKKKCPTIINVKRFEFQVLGLVFLSGCCLPEEKLLQEGADKKVGMLGNPTPE